MVLYEDLSKAEVLCALYNNAQCRGLGALHYKNEDLTVQEARKLLNNTTYFDYLFGRVLKIDLKDDKGFKEWLYDRDNGEGAAQASLDEYRAKKTKTL